MRPFYSPDWWPLPFSGSLARAQFGVCVSRRSRPLRCSSPPCELFCLFLSLLLSTPHPLPTRGPLPSPASTSNSWFCVSTQNQDPPPVTPNCPFSCLWSLCWGPNPMQERQDQLSRPGATELALRWLSQVSFFSLKSQVPLALTRASASQWPRQEDPCFQSPLCRGSVSSGWCVPLMLPRSGKLSPVTHDFYLQRM